MMSLLSGIFSPIGAIFWLDVVRTDLVDRHSVGLENSAYVYVFPLLRILNPLLASSTPARRRVRLRLILRRVSKKNIYKII